MRGNPRNAAPEHRTISTTPPDKARADPTLPVRVSTSSFVRPKVLMGEVTMPRGQQIANQREAFRAFMMAHHLRPTDWAKKAGIPTGEILAFLAGTARNVAPASLEKLAHAAGCTPEDLLR
jgi:DNA-binding Xre family transcriptional regulator